MVNSVIVIPCNAPWEWSTDYINQTARLLSKTNTVICIFWLDALSIREHIFSATKKPVFFKQIEPGILGYYMIHLLPFRRFDYIYSLNISLNLFVVKAYIYLLNLQRKFAKKIIWFFDPVCYPVILQFSQAWISVYDCIDYFRGSILLSRKQKKQLILEEDVLIKKSTLVVVNSHILYKLHSAVRGNIVVVSQGFRLKEFQNTDAHTIVLPKDKPIIGYIGALNYRLDYSLLVSLAKKMPNFQFAFIGPLQVDGTPQDQSTLRKAQDALFALKNVTVIFGVDKNEIQNIISQINIGIIPYRIDMKFNTYCYPMKLFEYFYMGKPVISTQIEELKRFPKYILIGSRVEEWKLHIKNLLATSWSVANKRDQKKLAMDNTWEEKISHILAIIESRRW